MALRSGNVEPGLGGHGSRLSSDAVSIGSSIELKDTIIDDSWFWSGAKHSVQPSGRKTSGEAGLGEAINVGDVEPPKGSFLSRWIQSWQDRALIKRLDKFDMDEIKAFVAQKLFKVDGIICDEQTKLMLVEKMVINPIVKDFDAEKEELSRKYGTRLVGWIKDRLVPTADEPSVVLDRALKDFNYLKQVDPLATWYKQNSECCARMLERVQHFGDAMANMVQYSLLIEPGTITPHLSEFIAEFRQLETFFERNEMTSSESSQCAFAANFLTKARNKLLECADFTRVELREAASEVSDSFRATDVLSSARRLALFSDQDVPVPLEPQTDYGTSDFIHASYVRGGPLLNTFILTQAPMASTLADFWRMVWQERCQYIIMLCSAVDVNRLGLLDSAIPSFCPYYWPKLEGGEMHCGDLVIRNECIDGALDPVFNVTYISVRRASDTAKKEILLVEHWQHDWKDYTDCRWPLRVLRRARLSPTPTIVQCVDGCGRAGTLVTIEAMLMHMLRGSALYPRLVLTTALFVRLQRRHAIASPLQYLFIYRTLLYWMQPYITSIHQRLYLGLVFPEWGFLGKYNKLIANHVNVSSA